MICANCGATNPAESAYCGGCGSLLAPAPEVAGEGDAPKQEPQVIPPPESGAQEAAAVHDDMPTYHTMQPVAAQDSPAAPVEDVPTVRAVPAQSALAASEFMNIAPVSAPAQPGANVQPASPTPVVPQASGSFPPVAPGYPGAVYQQAPGYPGAVYQQQAPVQAPGYSSGPLYPPTMPQMAPGMPAGAFPPATPQPGYPGGASYQAQGQSSGVFPPATPLPGYPSGALYPTQGQPSGVFPPTNEFPAGVYASPFPGQPAPGGWDAYAAGAPQAPPQPSAPSKLINPMPLWAFISSIVVIVVLLAILTFFTGADWAAGAQTAGIVALIIGVLILIAFGVRAGLGMLVETNPHRRSQMISSLLLTLLLVAVGAIGLTQQAAIHSAQAHSLEGQHNWQAAINEYQDGGQSKPSSEDIARVYNEWGEQYVSEGQYSDGIHEFEAVTGNSDGVVGYTLAATGFARAKNDAINAYQTWAQQAAQQQKYDQATQHYDKLLAEPYCDTSCQTQTTSVDATAYYKLAEQKLNQQPPDYASAVAAFNYLTAHFSSSSSSQGAHADYAKALWGDGQQLLNTTCSSALTLYQQLSSQFSDTPQGQQATTALTQPEAVTGSFTSNIPGNPDVPTVALVQGISPGMSDAQFTAVLSKAPLAVVKSDGTFAFKPVKQGSYYLIWGTFNQNTGAGEFYDPLTYPAVVGPLCTLAMSPINEAFPKA